MNDNVHQLPPQKGRGNADKDYDAGPEPQGERPRRDLSKISLVISLLSLVLVGIFLFGINRNLSGLSREVQSYGTLKNSVVSLDAYVDDLLEQMGRVNAQMLEMDERRKAAVVKILMESMLDDMIQKTTFLTTQLGNAPEAARLHQVQALLLELRHPAAMAAQPPAAPLPKTPAVAPPSPGPEAATQAQPESQPAPQPELGGGAPSGQGMTMPQ